MALVVGDDGAEVGVGVANVDSGRIAALDVDLWGSGRSGNYSRDWIWPETTRLKPSV